MQVNARKEQRSRCRKNYAISWQGEDGLTRSTQAQGVDLSPSGVGLLCPEALQPGVSVYIQDNDHQIAGYSVVRHCTPRGGDFFIGLELNQETKQTVALPADESSDYYDFLQISPKAESATIHRVYRFLAARFHPDNPESGDPEKFLLLNRAFAVLSDPKRRADYDATLEGRVLAIPAFESIDFMDGVEGELNRRLAVLSLLYRRCRANVENPRVSLAEMETLMGFPREYLDFTTWYLRSKKYITREDNSDFALTVLGVDFVEANYSRLPVLRKLLCAGPRKEKDQDRREGREGRELHDEIFVLEPAGSLDGHSGG